MRRAGTYGVARSRVRLDLEMFWAALYALVPDVRQRREVYDWLRSVGAAPRGAKWPGYFPGRWRAERVPGVRPGRWFAR